MTRCKELLRKQKVGDGLKNILFSEKKIFTVEEKLNRQNDRLYTRSRKEIPQKFGNSTRVQKPGYVMVWYGMSWTGKAKMLFVPQRIKVRARNYIDDILEIAIKLLSQILFSHQDWTFQQDSALSHKAKIIQQWLKNNVPCFISSEE